MSVYRQLLLLIAAVKASSDSSKVQLSLQDRTIWQCQKFQRSSKGVLKKTTISSLVYEKPDEWSEISRLGPLSRTNGVENLNAEPETSVELSYSLTTSSSDDSVATDHPLPLQQPQHQPHQRQETKEVPQQQTEPRPHYEHHMRNHRQQVNHYNKIQKQKNHQQEGDYDRRPSWSKQPLSGLEMASTASTNLEAGGQRQLPSVPQPGIQET